MIDQRYCPSWARRFARRRSYIFRTNSEDSEIGLGLRRKLQCAPGEQCARVELPSCSGKEQESFDATFKVFLL